MIPDDVEQKLRWFLGEDEADKIMSDIYDAINEACEEQCDNCQVMHPDIIEDNMSRLEREDQDTDDDYPGIDLDL